MLVLPDSTSYAETSLPKTLPSLKPPPIVPPNLPKSLSSLRGLTLKSPNYWFMFVRFWGRGARGGGISRRKYIERGAWEGGQAGRLVTSRSRLAWGGEGKGMLLFVFFLMSGLRHKLLPEFLVTAAEPRSVASKETSCTSVEPAVFTISSILPVVAEGAGTAVSPSVAFRLLHRRLR